MKNVPLPRGRIRDREYPQTPPLAGHALLRYAHPLAGGVGSLQLDTVYTGRFCFSVNCGEVDVSPERVVGNARLAYESGLFEFAFFVENLADEAYRVYSGDTSAVTGAIVPIYARPRWFGGSVAVRFTAG